jgi:hypothetical protein
VRKAHHGIEGFVVTTSAVGTDHSMVVEKDVAAGLPCDWRGLPPGSRGLPATVSVPVKWIIAVPGIRTQRRYSR